jgi:hypothetical protein
MFNVRPSFPWLGFHVEPPVEEEVPGLHNWRPDEVPGLHNWRRNEEVPGLHNWRPSEEAPGFRMKADGSVRQTAAPAAQLRTDVSGNPFGLFDLYGVDAFTPVGDVPPPPYLGRWPTGSAPSFGPAPAGAMLPSAGPWSQSAHTLLSHTVSPNPPSSSNLPPSPFVSTRNAWPAADRTDDPNVVRAADTQIAQNQPPPLFVALGHATKPPPMSEQPSPMSLRGPLHGLAKSAVEVANAVDPNVIRVADDGLAVVDDEVQVAQQQRGPAGLDVTPDSQQGPAQKPPSKLRKDLSPGVAVVLPDGSNVTDPKSPTGQLMAPLADLSAVAAAGRKAGEQYNRMLQSGSPFALIYLMTALGTNVGQGGVFDYQREGNRITGYTHLQQFKNVSNLNVGLFGQQAGLTLEELLTIAGKFACNFSGNARPDQPYCLHPDQLEYITRGYQIGRTGVFDPPPPR